MSKMDKGLNFANIRNLMEVKLGFEEVYMSNIRVSWFVFEEVKR